jgi:cardiolipin synthase
MENKQKIRPAAFTPLKEVKLVYGGKAYFDLLLQLIGKAVKYIHLQTYIFDDDETGRLVAAALKEAALRNVEVYLLADGYASQGLSNKFIDDLLSSGIRFRYFEPLFRSRHYYFGRRLHHKIFVADAQVSLVGGINISDRYNDLPGKPSWHDYALYTEGEISRELCLLCWKTWNGFQVKPVNTVCTQQTKSANLEEGEISLVRIRRNDWVKRKNEVSSTYIEMFRNAESHITIMCSYFLPGKIIRRLLKNASKRGVEISVITAGPSDVMMAKRAERWLYDWLLRNKIQLYEYQPTILHAKVAVCDGRWFTIGSYNINNISAYASIELNLDVRNENQAKALELHFANVIENECIQITEEQVRKSKNIFIQFSRWFSYQFIRLAFYSLTFYFKRNNQD